MKKLMLTALLSLASMNLFAACDDPAAPGVDWSGCDKSGQYLWHANLSNADLSDARGLPGSITSAVWFNTACPDLTNSDSNGNTCAGHFLEDLDNSRSPEPSAIPTLSFWTLGLLPMFMLLLGFRFSRRS